MKKPTDKSKRFYWSRQVVHCADIPTHRDYLGFTADYIEYDSKAASAVLSAQHLLDGTMPELGSPAHAYYATAVRLMREVYRLRKVIVYSKSENRKLREFVTAWDAHRINHTNVDKTYEALLAARSDIDAPGDEL